MTANPVPTPGEERLRLTRFSEIPPTPVRWLAPRWLPRGAFAVLIGDEGIGKSLWWVHLAAAISSGRAVPEIGMPAQSGGEVVVILTEDTAGEVAARLDAANATMSKILLITLGPAEESPTFPDRTAELVSMLESADVSPALIVIDVWLDTVAGSLSVRDAQQSALALAPWRTIAQQLDAAVLLIGHTNRMASGSVRDKTGATASLRKKARGFLFAMRPIDDNGRERPDALYIGPDKANSSGGAPALEYRLSTWRTDPAAGAASPTAAALEFVRELPHPIGEYVRERHAAESDTRPRGDSRAAREWLIGYMNADRGRLETGMLVGRLKEVGEQEGHKIRTVERVMPEIGASRQSGGVGSPWLYHLDPAYWRDGEA